MIRNRLIQTCLLPISLLYGLIIMIRDALYKFKLLRSIHFNLPIIGVGNLAIGGSGKTPHVEYLIKLLSPYLDIAVMSRGYKRKSRGFRIANQQDNVESIGDEPLQYFLKFKDIVVSVSESRSVGIPLLLSQKPNLQAIVLDDSYQHRSVLPGLNILLTDYAKPYYNDFLLPSGRLREWRSGANRADIIVVSKCPNQLAIDAKNKITSKLNPSKNQQIYFTYYKYHNPYHLFTGIFRELEKNMDIILLTAIASTEYLIDSLIDKVNTIIPVSFEDHHYFSPHEMSQLTLQYKNLNSDAKLILTTEKDAARLSIHYKYIREQELPIFVLPISIEFLFNQKDNFDSHVKSFLMNFSL